MVEQLLMISEVQTSYIYKSAISLHQTPSSSPVEMLFAVSSSLLLLLPLLGVVNAATPGYSCTTIPGKLRQIDAGFINVFGVNSNDEIYRWVYTGWKKMEGKLMHVTVGYSGVWGVNRANEIFHLQNDEWILVPGRLKQIDAGGDNFVAGVNSQNQIFCSKPTVDWKQVVGVSLKYYSCGQWGCWGVNDENDVFVRKSVSTQSCQGNGWEQVEGKMAMIEVSTEGYVYGINPDGIAFQRKEVNFLNPTGESWIQLDLGHTFKHLSYHNDYLWLITLNDDIIRCGIARWDFSK